MAKEIKDWITINHKHIPIYEGESKADAYNRAMVKANEEKKKKEINQNKEQADRLKESAKKNTAPKNAKVIATYDRKHRQTDKDLDIEDLVGDLKDPVDANDSFSNRIVRANMNNKKFMDFGREYGGNAIQQLWFEQRRRQEIKDLHEMPIEEAADKIRENISSGVLQGWFREANSEMKPNLARQIFMNKGVLNAGLNVAYHNYKTQELKYGEKPLPFKEWLTTPMTLYRGTKGQKMIDSDVFTSYTARKGIAREGAKGNGMLITQGRSGRGRLHTMKVRPIDTWGSYQTNAESEYLIPLSVAELAEKRKRK